ncbi:hypothetical protein [Escherichia coli]|uniref:hypothetical protein n=1 Tax=Escherichia coli TaxID=562 RepID=UPI00201A964A|nr:hypothetical protein [Escherichia coli]
MDCNVAAASEGVAVAAATATPAIDDVSAGLMAGNELNPKTWTVSVNRLFDAQSGILPD